MKQWYYLLEGQRKGPVAEPDLINLIDNGLISPDTLVWSEGMPEWQKAGDIAELRAFPASPPVVPPPQPRVPSPPPVCLSGMDPSSLPSGPQVRPWVRFWARFIDYSLISFPINIILITIFNYKLKGLMTVLFSILIGFAFIFIEAVCLFRWGTTPGKAALRIRVLNRDGSMLSSRQALDRSFVVWAAGESAGIPLVNYIANLINYFRLTDKGVTYWDETGNHAVIHQIIGSERVAAVVILLVFMSLVELALDYSIS